MFMKRPKHKVFEYTPRFYNPEEDEELKELERRKRRLGFRRNIKIKRRRGSTVIYLALIILIIYLFLKFNVGL